MSNFELLKKTIVGESPKKFILAIKRYETFSSFSAFEWDIKNILLNKIKALSKYAVSSKTQTLKRMPYKKRLSLLISFVIVYTIYSQDDVIDYMIYYFQTLFRKAERKTEKTRLRTLKDLDKSARELNKICSIIVNESISDEYLRTEIFSKVSKENLTSIIEEVNALTRPVNQSIDFEELFKYYRSIRIFLPKLLSTVEFNSSLAGANILDSWNFLKNYELNKSKNKFNEAPIHEVNSNWKKEIIKNGIIKVCPYTFWAIENMLRGLKNQDIFLENSYRYSDPKSQLIKSDEWAIKSQDFIEASEWSENSMETVSFFKNELHKAYAITEKNWHQNQYVKIDTLKNRIILSPLEKVEEPKSLKKLKNNLESLLPKVSLPELLFEINSKTYFLNEFSHISQFNTKIKDLEMSLCAIIIAKACNIGFIAVSQKGVVALEYDRLMWIWHNYFSKENSLKVNSILIEYMQSLNLANIWVNGEIVSADGIRYIVPLKTIYADHNPKYFGLKRGITSYELINDQFIGLNRIIITGTIRDSLYLLDLVLGNNSEIKTKEIMTDTAGYSDIIFGLFGLLGYQFSPRISGIGDSRFWKFDINNDSKIFENLSKNKLRENLIHKYWDDILRIIASLRLGRAIGEIGKIFKTIHQLNYLNDADYRRRILIQLNRGESENSLRRAIMYGKKGELLNSYREEQEEQMNILALVTNSIIIWNTIYMEMAVNYLKEHGEKIILDDLKRLSPLGFQHINILGNYNFEIPVEILDGKFRDLDISELNLF